MNEHQLQILDCTLRDGSYAIDFQFNEEDTFKITRGLSESQIPYIEIGHGVGLGASDKGFGIAAATDQQYCIAASKGVLGNSKWGMFCIPGIASLEDLKMAIDHGMDFVRIGSDINRIDETKSFISLARKSGVQVFANFMKSYVVSPEEFAQKAKRSFEFGSDVVYIVDSAGGMLPDQLRKYIRATFDLNNDAKLGFHGHNNLGLGMGNCMVCIEEGINYLDSTLQGLGRSSGNVATEHLVCVLDRLNFEYPWDPIKIMDLGEVLVRPLISQFGMSSLDITAGWSEFHSSYMKSVLKRSKKERLDPRKIIKKLCEQDKVSLNVETLNEIVTELHQQSSSAYKIKNWPNYFGDEELMI